MSSGYHAWWCHLYHFLECLGFKRIGQYGNYGKDCKRCGFDLRNKPTPQKQVRG